MNPTKRAVVDVGRKCNAFCKFCYYHHLGDLTKQEFTDKKELMVLIDKAKDRGNDYIDFTGGEPTIHPDMPELVRYVKGKGLGCCIITNALCGPLALDKLIAAGVDDFLISIHGMEDTHNAAVGIPDARARQERFIAQVNKSACTYRMNCVINSSNQAEIDYIAGYAVTLRPRIVNFINMNPHGDWAGDIEGTKKTVANLRVVETKLNAAIRKLEEAGIGVNVRYYPMCRIAEEYRRCVCNDLQTCFDPFEWDYDIQPKDVFAFRRWGIHTSNCMEHKGEPCKSCDLQWVCGGVNKAFFRAQPEAVSAVTVDGIDKMDAFFYRRHNVLTIGNGGAE